MQRGKGSGRSGSVMWVDTHNLLLRICILVSSFFVCEKHICILNVESGYVLVIYYNLIYYIPLFFLFLFFFNKNVTCEIFKLIFFIF